MDVLIWFKSPNTTPADYIRSEIDLMDVTWDDVDHPDPFLIEGPERMVLAIVLAARRDENCEKVTFL